MHAVYISESNLVDMYVRALDLQFAVSATQVTITTIPENVSIQEFHSRPFRSDATFKGYVL